MPECYRCGRVQPTAEVRQTKLGWLCKDNAKFSRCWQLAQEAKAIAKAATRATRRRRRRWHPA